MSKNLTGGEPKALSRWEGGTKDINKKEVEYIKNEDNTASNNE